jgi:sulfoxide reductase heme-binding subunit YedZ
MTGPDGLVPAFLKSRFFYPLAFLGCAVPGLLVVRATFAGDLGVNPVETLLHETGRAALLVLLTTLAITPIRRLTGWNRVQHVRRMVGVWSAFYALCHFLIYVVFNHLGDVAAIAKDIADRPFITLGMLALSILLILAATSTNGMMRRLGKNWQRLHRLVYVAATAGIVHFAWGQKAEIREPIQWALVLAVLFGVRVFFFVRKRRARLMTATAR